MDEHSVELGGGATMPLLAFGTWPLRGGEARTSVRTALEAGYRHVDTATAYGNETEVGAALRESGLARTDVFVTTKCPPEEADRARQTLEASLAALGVDYVDLWLVHWPPDGQARPDVWQLFAEAADDGLARSIGVSNYSTSQLDELIAAVGVTPAVNQIPWSPSLYDQRRAAEHRERGVVLQAYSPLKRSRLDGELLGSIAAVHGASAAQVVLRWHVQHCFAVVVKSARRERIEENLDLDGFELTDEEVERLDGLGSGA